MGVAGYTFSDGAFWESVLRWGHVLVAIMWIGHLYYFNFTQIPNMPKIPDEQKPAVTKVIAPAALYWFRWGAMLTLITGALLAWNQGYILQALTLGALDDPSFAVPKHILIGIGMWLAIIMWFNVWFIIWPNQQKALNIDNKYPESRRGGEGGRGQDGDAVLAHQHVPLGADAGGDDGREHAVLGLGIGDWAVGRIVCPTQSPIPNRPSRSRPTRPPR